MMTESERAEMERYIEEQINKPSASSSRVGKVVYLMSDEKGNTKVRIWCTMEEHDEDEEGELL
jgi:hypothetical protein